MTRRTILLGLLVLVYSGAFPQWIQQSSGTSASLSSVFFIDSNNGWIAGGGGTILHTTNGGNQWIQQFSGTTTGLGSIHFTDANSGWMCGNTILLSTTNGGNQWIPRSTGFSVNQYFSVYFTDDNNGWCAIAQSINYIIHTSNGGTSWAYQLQSGGHFVYFYGLHFLDALNGWAIDGHYIFRTTNGGNAWAGYQVVSIGTGANLFFHFPDAYNGWIVGTNGLVLHTINSGVNWTQQTSGSTRSFRSVNFSDANNGWVVGDSGLILNTNNGGAQWIQQFSGTSQRLLSVCFPDANNGWAVGEGGVILHTSNGGTDVEEQTGGQIPSRFVLDQNYPNPFNPITNIQLQIPSTSFVTLKVFDVLGREVATLVNEEMRPGRHERTFDGSGRASGVYFYRLQAGNFTSVMKLILSK